MEGWRCSDCDTAHLEGLIHRGLMPVGADPLGWILPGKDRFPQSPDGYVVSVADFHERSFAVPPHRFLLVLLDHWRLELQHLDPIRIHHAAAFVAQGEGYLGIDSLWDLWCYFFIATLRQEKVHGRGEESMPVGCVEIHLRPTRAHEYLPARLAAPHKGRCSGWFYLKNIASLALPEHFLPRFTSGSPEAHSERWVWGVPKREVKKIVDHLRLSGS